MRSKHQRRIEEFMELAGQNVLRSPRIVDLDVRRLRAILILEEALETINALGFKACNLGDTPKDFELEDKGPCDIIEVADGCADISVVTIGTLSAFGINDKELLKEVDESNLRKFGPGGHRREDGKWIKPPDWKSPDIEGVLKSQGYVK